jgi:hypothetical protein
VRHGACSRALARGSILDNSIHCAFGHIESDDFPEKYMWAYEVVSEHMTRPLGKCLSFVFRNL